ncbi:hypothetical protein LTR27_003270 [Elasticomyces elasticus]|nr:hypothetical protein LTR27_003270 [Elasticomyces elasticus]
MDTSQAEEPSPVVTQTAPQTWHQDSMKLRFALADFGDEMLACTATSEKICKRLRLRNHALSNFATNAQHAALAEKVEAVTRDVVKKSTQLLSEVESFADRGTECPICTEPLDQDAHVSGPMVQISPCKHQFHDNCLHKALQCRDTCPECRGDLAAVNEVDFETGEIVEATRREGGDEGAEQEEEGIEENMP